MEFAFYTEQYKLLAKTLAGIIMPSRKYYSPQEVVNIIQSLTGNLHLNEIIVDGSLTYTVLTGLPTLWPTRSAAAFLLCLHCVDSRPVMTYFKHLSLNDHMGMAVDMLSNVFYIASDFISAEPLVTHDYIDK